MHDNLNLVHSNTIVSIASKSIFIFTSMIFAALSLVFLASCDDEPTDNDINHMQIWPMEVGNFWVYQSATILEDSILGYDTVKFVVSGKVSISGSEWFLMGGEGKPKKEMYINKPDGLWKDKYDSGMTVNTQDIRMILKYPTKTGDKIFWKDETTETVAKNIPVSTPAGNFKCLHYLNRAYREIDLYFCPGIGMISQKFITMISHYPPNPKLDTIWIEMKLLDYNVK